MLRVGLTGGIASGKSTILRMFARLGCRTVDADSIVSSLYRPGHAGHDAIVRTYGAEVLQASGEIDRSRLAAIAFSSSEEARRLNALIHPLVLEEEALMMGEAERSDPDAIYVVEATLLIESGGRDRYDRIVVVDVTPEVQLARAQARGVGRDEALRRIAHQMPREERLRHADFVIDNSGDEPATWTQAVSVVERLREELLRAQKAPGPGPGASKEP